MKISKSMVSKTTVKIIAFSAILFWLFLLAPQATLAHSFADLPGHTYTKLGIGCNSAADCETYYNLSCDDVNKYCSLIKSGWAGSPAATTAYPSLNCFYNGAPAIALCGQINCDITNPQANPRGECLYGKPDKSGTSIIETGFVQGTPEPEKPFELLSPFASLQIKIPGLEKIVSENPATCETTDDQTSCSLPWIAVYIKAIYNYAMGIVGILAALTLMIGGVIYLTSTGNATRISEAKSWITGALTGMLIMFTSYVLLNEVNPDLIGFKPIELNIVEDDLGGDTNFIGSGGLAGFGDPFSTNNNNTGYLEGIGIYCPGSGGSTVIPYIANSFKDKIVYRLGSKNGEGSEMGQSNPEFPYGMPCPNSIESENNLVVCYDCSGFVRQVLSCAGFTKDPGMGTAIIFGKGSEEIKKCKDNMINDIKVNPGDLIGWPASGKLDNQGHLKNDGHVLIYSADSTGPYTISESHGIRSYPPAKAYAATDICTYIKSKGPGTKKDVQHFYIKRLGTY